MGVSADGQICFGYLFEEGYEFPWDRITDGDVEKWWIYHALGYKNPFEIFNEMGNYIDGYRLSDKTMNEYYEPYFAFKKEHPLPVKLINYGGGNYPMYILATPGSFLSNDGGYPKPFEPDELEVGDISALQKFCEDYDIEIPGPTDWYLLGYWR